MSPRTPRLSLHSLALWPLALITGFAGSAARADALYTITDLGTLSGQSSSVATSINNQGQVVGISYNGSDGYFASQTGGPADPPRFAVTGDGSQSFLYSNGQTTPISPIGGLAMSINNLGQVVGGPYASINDSGQYIGGTGSGVYNTSYSLPDQLVSGGTTTTLAYFAPLAINNAGQIAGSAYAAVGPSGNAAAVYQNGQVKLLLSTPINGQESAAVAINQKGDILFTVWQQGGSPQASSFLYHADNGTMTNLSSLAGGSTFIAAALNDNGQAVGNGYIYNSGTIETLASLFPISSRWTNLNATGINDSGQIVGQGTYDGQQVAFLMTPDAIETPEPGTLAIWGLIAAGAAGRTAALASSRRHGVLGR
jgi:uncharacterized membrane protein